LPPAGRTPPPARSCSGRSGWRGPRLPGAPAGSRPPPAAPPSSPCRRPSTPRPARNADAHAHSAAADTLSERETSNLKDFSMARLAAICAPQPLPNPGMAAVDMALSCFVKRALPEAALKVFRLFSLEERNPEMSPERRARFALQARLPIPAGPLLGRLDE